MEKIFLIALLFSLLSFVPTTKFQKTIHSSTTTKTLAFSNNDPDSLDQTQFFPVISQSGSATIFKENPEYVADGFDFPVGKPDAKNYYKALSFGQKYHLGEDWNGTGGGDTDLGDAVYTIGHGVVVYADDICCGWGNTVRVVHYLPDHKEFQYIESIYSHLYNIQVKAGDLIRRGDQIGTIGTANGRYLAHLHLELRDFINMSIGPGYSPDQYGYLNPSAFIKVNRPIKPMVEAGEINKKPVSN